VIFKKKDVDVITFFSMVDGLADHDECTPKPSNKYIPQWWKETPLLQSAHTLEVTNAGNIKNCPSFPDYFSQGYILPMWADSIIKYDKTDDIWKWRTSSPDFTWDCHGNDQFINSKTPLIYGTEGSFVFKALSPWKIQTPPGYSVMQLPLFYEFNPDFTVLPGIIDSDREHDLNLQVLYHTNQDEIFIKRGTPMAQYIPFKRTDRLPMVFRDATKEDKKMYKKSNNIFHTKFMGSKSYITDRKMQNTKDNTHE